MFYLYIIIQKLKTMKTIKDYRPENNITIPVIFNDGTRAEIIWGAEIYLNGLPGKVFYDCDKGYMHIDEALEPKYYGQSWQPSEEEYKETVRRLCILYFASKLEISHPFFRTKEIAYKKRFVGIKKALREFFFEDFPEKKFSPSFRRLRLWEYDHIEVVEKMKCPPLGANWQKYFQGKEWLPEAEALKGSKIYIC